MSTVEALKSAEKFIGELPFSLQRDLELRRIHEALSEVENSEPVAEAIRERDRLGFSVVNVIGKLDEIIENNQEVEVDDFLHIAVPIDMWNELQSSLEDMPKRADLFTFPPKREWVAIDLTEYERQGLGAIAQEIEAKLKELNHD